MLPIKILLKIYNNFDFYKKSIESGRTVILDNSVFELGTAFKAEVTAGAAAEHSKTKSKLLVGI